jgi:alanine dehydrogenase
VDKKISVGFPRMKKESGERRVFLPEFIQFLTRFANVYLEEGYGSRSGFTFDDYRRGNSRVRLTNRAGAFGKDYVIILRSPNDDEFQLLRRNASLISMLHYPTRPGRVQILQELGIRSISMDSIVDDHNLRLVENMHAVAWNGLEAAFDVLEQDCPGLLRNDSPYRVLVLGTGMVGKHAMEAGTKLGNIERNNRHIDAQGPGSIAMCIGRNITDNPVEMERLFHQTDVLVDATSRRNTSLPVVPNDWIAWLPETAVIVDLAVDPYLPDGDPPVVRGIEGIPQGNLSKYVFAPQDPEWDACIPTSVPSKYRRRVVTCYSWPGIHPAACMEHYARQLSPLMEVLLTRPYDQITLEGDYFGRALARAKLPGV